MLEALEGLATLFRDFGPWGLLATSLFANAYLYRRGEALHAATQVRIDTLYQQRLAAAEAIISAQTASTTQATAAMNALNASLERLRSDVLVRRDRGTS